MKKSKLENSISAAAMRRRAICHSFRDTGLPLTILFSLFATPLASGQDFSDVEGWNQLVYYGSLRLASVNGDRYADICGRGAAGIYCALNNGDGTFAPAHLWTESFSNAAGWARPEYGTTIMFADINGDGRADVCGRGVGGIICALSTGTAFGPEFRATNEFSDVEGWNQLVYYGSLRLASVNGDRYADICGRGAAGIYCALNNGDGTFAPAHLWTESFSNAAGWARPEYGTTIMFADINGDGRADVCGRGVGGIICALSTGTAFGPEFRATNEFSDVEGWNQLVYYGSLRLASVNGDRYADICGRGAAGIYCALNNGDGTFAPAHLWTSDFSDGFGRWGEPPYGTTIMFADINGDGRADVCGRSGSGIVCGSSSGRDFVSTLGGDNEVYREYDLHWYEGCGNTDKPEGDLYLTDTSFKLFGPYIGSSIPLENVPGVAYDDYSVRIENVRKTDYDSLTVSKFSDHVHFMVTLSVPCFDGQAAHRYIRIHVRGRR